MPLGTFICRDFSVLLVRPTEAPRTCSTNEGGAQKHRRRKCPHAPSVRMFPGTLMGAEARDGYVPMSPFATAIGPSGMGQSSVHSKKTRVLGKSVLTNGFAQLIATCARLCPGSSGPGVGLVSHRRLETATVWFGCVPASGGDGGRPVARLAAAASSGVHWPQPLGEGMHSLRAASTCTHMMVHALARRGRAPRADRLAIL